MAYKIGNRMQPIFLPSTIDDYVGTDDPVRVYDAFVDALDFPSLGIPLEPQPGADEYYPKDLLKVVIYAYSYGIRSSRKIERACYHNLSFQWLMGGQKPDYRTIARFRSEYKEQIKKVLKQCVQICMDLDLIEGNVLFTDGSKFRANASINNTWTKEKCEKSLKKINEHIDQLVDECEKIDSQEDADSLVKLHKKIEDKQELVQKIQRSLQVLKETNEKSMNSTDPDSIKAKGRQGTHASYNVQISVDNKHALIVSGEAVSVNNDRGQLKNQVAQSSENLGQKPKTVCADAGYSSAEDTVQIDDNIKVIVPTQKQVQKERGQMPGAFDKEQFSYSKDKDEYVCPEGKSLKYRRLQKERQAKVYQADGKDCQRCQHFGVCTTSPNGRIVKRLVHEDHQKHLEEVYQSPQGQEIYQLRKEKVEHPFGHFKRNLSAGQFMLRGKDKVNAEVSILSTCFNIARMITIIGISELIAKLNSG
jgi:transposase